MHLGVFAVSVLTVSACFTLVDIFCGETSSQKCLRCKTLEVKSKRAFLDTPYGQIHYKYGGDFTSADTSAVLYTFLLFHGNPRSSDEFSELINEMAGRFANISDKFSFIALDMFGEGHSDNANFVSTPEKDYVSMEEYAEFMIEIAGEKFEADSNAVRYLVLFGSLTGSAVAAELSYQLRMQNRSLCKTGSCEVVSTILHDPMYYFSDQIVANVRMYAKQQQAWEPSKDGEHLVQIWNDPNYQPYEDLALQDRKSLDRFRAATTQWQVILGYADYSSRLLLGRLTALSRFKPPHNALPLIILYGGEFMSDPMTEKIFEVQKMKGLIADATKGGLYETVIGGGNQALLSQNVTLVADIIMSLVVYKN